MPVASDWTIKHSNKKCLTIKSLTILLKDTE